MTQPLCASADCQSATLASAPSAAGLHASGLGIQRNGRWLLRDIDVRLVAGEFTAIVGPNGAGKSTLLGAFAGSVRPDAGTVSFDASDLHALPADELARRRAVLGQRSELQFPFLVHEVVSLGRLPHHGRCTGAEDDRAVEQAIDTLELDALAEREYTSLSGGERQRVDIARCLAQVWDATPRTAHEPACARWLLLDEPTSALDLRHRIALMKRLQALARAGWGIVAVLHDLALVRRWTDRRLLLREGLLVADERGSGGLSRDTIARVFDVDGSDLD